MSSNNSERVSGLMKVVHRIRDGLSMYRRPLGLRGVLAISTYRLFGWPKELRARPLGIRKPVHLRMRTTDISIYDQVLLGRQYDFDLPFLPATIVDAGANIGMASIYYANKYPDAKIIAVEAEASNFAILTHNVRPYPNILAIHAALWNRDGEISLAAPSALDCACCKVGFVVSEGKGVPVRGITMRTLMKEAQIHSIDVLKVDIEGAEKEVFESCDWIENVRCLMIELHDRLKPGSSAAVNSVTRDFVTSQSGETTVYLRKSRPGIR
jgi:FkbM family methyltransferase